MVRGEMLNELGKRWYSVKAIEVERARRGRKEVKEEREDRKAQTDLG